MFPLQLGDDMVFRPPSVIKRDQILQDLTMDHTLVENSNHSTSRGGKGDQGSSGIQENKDGSTFDGSNIRKLMHRDLERQRRQEMANLYASLRSIVPVEYLKGKKTISDHTQGAINYITDMQKNIRKLRYQRDKLKKLSNSGNLSDEDGSSTSFSHGLVTVNPCRDGAEILIRCSLKEEGFPLSIVLVELLERGLNVVNYVSTKTNEMPLHIIQCEASDIRCNDLSELTERLTDVITLRRVSKKTNIATRVRVIS
ncbi:unnamed protein product [Fraxinus pennsylvanica]|uniref:BHLH domain-containing protein n=1 Tax=Fraxinus pennsylvanica TaxID=56036 RepID=A0AAD1ZDA9_9LAMI|nr:unnamed protein product [Fraxinus pennsylvanica]